MRGGAWWLCFVLLAACKGDDSGDSNFSDEGGSETGTSQPFCLADGLHNGSETDIDCGGPDCPDCPIGDTCLLDSDCETLNCDSDVCVAPSCSDMSLNQDETDLDCGGSCPPCEPGKTCMGGPDCSSGVCEDNSCLEPTCTDGVENASETGVDCGGFICEKCPVGQGCSANIDCVSGYCMNGTCAESTCASDEDCADLGGPCKAGVCSLVSFTCEVEAINEDMECDDGDPCTLGTVCTDTECAGGAPPDCTALDDVCLVGECNPADGTCMASPANEGGACDDSDPCTNGDACASGVCSDADGPDIHLDEDFADNDAGWTLDTYWEIGPAVASAPGTVGSGDPDTDTTPTADNGIAGIVIGGHVDGSGPPRYLESPVIDLSAAPGDLQLRLQRWLNADVASSTHETIEVYDGTNWVVLWENDETITDETAWSEMTLDVTDHKNDAFQIRIGHDGAGGAPAIAGWNVDDIRIAPPTCP